MIYKRLVIGVVTGALFMCTFSSVATKDFIAAISSEAKGDTGNNGSSYVTNDIINIAVPVSGVRNVNDLTDSDYKTTIELLGQANKHYDREDGLTEFFFTGNTERKIDDLPISVSWLIENNIVNRDKKLTISQNGNNFPNVTLEKDDFQNKLIQPTTKTEFISALYRAVYGPIQSRGVGLHFTGFRNVDGKWQQYTSYTYDYKPTGDYILKNYIEDATIEVNNYLDLDVQGGHGGSGSDGGSGGSGGDANVDITMNGKIETYQFQPAGDTLYYFTNDVAELYISAALNKGILDKNNDNIKQTFLDQHNKSSISNGIVNYVKWDSRLNPKIFGTNLNEMKQRSNVAESTIGGNAFGSGYTVNGYATTLTIEKIDENVESSAIFTDEYSMTKMDVYNYIYRFLTSGEKIMSDLETDIISYKYSARFDGLVKPEDIKAVQYLTAKGIINFDSTDGYKDLYTSISWDKTYDLLYRVANKDARYNFSEVQLTDSDKYWQKKGFSAEPLAIQISDTESQLTEVSSEAGQQQTLSVVPRNTVLGSVLNVLFLGSTGFDIKFDTSDINSLGFGNINFDSRVLTLSDDVIRSAIKESLQIVNKKQSDYSADLKAKIKNNDTNQQNTDWFNTSSSDNCYNTAKYILGNAYILNYYTNIGSDNGVNYTELYNAYKQIAFSFVGLKAGTSSNGQEIKEANIPSKFNFKFDGITLSELFSKQGNERVNYITDSLTGVHIVYTGNNEDVITVKKDKGMKSAQLKFCIMSDNSSNAEIQARSLIKENVSSNTGNIVVYTSGAVSTSGSSATSNASSNTQQVASYVSLTEIQSVYPNIVRISDTILQNTITGSYAYIHPETRTALVGTEVMSTCEEPVIKESGELSYDLNIISRLLPSATIKALDSSKTLYFTETLVAEENTETPVLGNDITGNTKVTSIQAINTLNSSGDPQPNAPQNTESNLYGAPNLTNAGYDTYIYAPTVDGSSNIIYKIISKGTNNLAIAVLRFIPDTSSSLLVDMPDSPTLSEMMSYVGTRPSTEEGKKIWDRNIALSNVYANWFYGTSDTEYLKTGLVKPSLSIILFDDNAEEEVLKELSRMKGVGRKTSLADFQNYIIENYKVNQVVDNQAFTYCSSQLIRGAIWSTSFNAASGDNPYGNITEDKYETYRVSNDKNYIFLKNRLYLSKDLLVGLKPVTYNGKFALQTTNTISGSMMWDIGQTLTIPYDTDGTVKNETATVIAKKGNYAVIQLAAIKGIPVYLQNSSKMILLKSSISSNANLVKDDLIQNKIQLILNKYPLIKQDDTSYLVSNPLSISAVSPEDRCIVTQNKVFYVSKKSTQWSASTSATAFNYVEGMTIKQLKDKVNATVDSTISKINSSVSTNHDEFELEKENGVYLAYAYPQLLVPMTEYVVSDGILTQHSSSMSDFMPPILFSSLNKYIVDAIIDESVGAIPVNEIPDGAVLSINNGAYVAKTKDNTKHFIGLTDIGFVQNMNITKPTIVDVCKSFASCMISCGNQFINVTQYFNSIKFEEETGTNAEMKILKELLNKNFDYYYSTGVQGEIERGTTRIIGPETAPQTSPVLTPGVYGVNTYAWTNISFEDGLMAYKISSDSAIPVYTLLSHSDNAVYGDLTDIPFFSDKALESNILDKTTELTSAGFRALTDAEAFMELIKENFENAFKGDLYTLFRLIVFCILAWLLIASWICYAMRLSRLGGILDLLKYPTGERNARGFDLLKIISLGTISMESDFTLARFVMYDLLISVLLVFVWKL